MLKFGGGAEVSNSNWCPSCLHSRPSRDRPDIHVGEMLEVRPGLLLGGMGDALAVFTRVPSVVARHQVTHVLSLCNERPEWMNELSPELETEGSGSGKEMEDIKEEEEAEGKSSLTEGVQTLVYLDNCVEISSLTQ